MKSTLIHFYLNLTRLEKISEGFYTCNTLDPGKAFITGSLKPVIWSGTLKVKFKLVQQGYRYEHRYILIHIAGFRVAFFAIYFRFYHSLVVIRIAFRNTQPQ